MKRLILTSLLTLALVVALITTVVGCAGEPGLKGDQGPMGLQGIQGEQGEPGSAGLQGEQGEPGPKGSTGAKGAAGPTGAQGAQGIQGEQGPAGPAGAGASGPRGPQGPQGPQGPEGPQGDPGIVSGIVVSYATIQDAIDAASPGATIMVPAGTYTENLVFDGDEANNITIQGATSVADDVVLNGYVHFTGSTTGLTFDTMKFKAECVEPGSSLAALFRTDGGSQESLTVNNCHIVKGETADSVFDAYGNTIGDNFEFTGNTVEDFADAQWGVLYFQVTGDPVNTGWKINDNDFINCGGTAITAMDQNGIEIKNNIIDYSDVSMNSMTCGAIQASLLPHPSPSDPQPITIEGNTVIGPGKDWKGGSTGDKFAAIAIYGFESGASATIGDNTVTDSYRGIVLTKASNVGISDNDIIGCSAGISFGGECSGISVSGNNLSSNDIGILFPSIPMEVKEGPYANSAGDNVFHFNNICGNTNYGIINETSVEIDATNNWWGTDITADVADMVSGNITYEPISPEPH